LLKFQAGKIDALSLRGQDYAFLKPREKEANFPFIILVRLLEQIFWF